jgi:hydroxylaminobenzene mutase
MRVLRRGRGLAVRGPGERAVLERMTETVIESSPTETALRHPLDPEPVRSTKAAAVLALGVAAVVTAPLVGGIIPATIGLALAREARGDLVQSQGYLTGARQLRIGVVLVWVALTIAIGALVAASVVGLLSLVGDAGSGQDFPPTSD